MKTLMTAVLSTFLLSGASALVAQSATKTERAAANKPDVTYGRVKEMTAGQKVVIDVDDAIDKSFDLSDKDLTVKMAKGLKVGDPVKVVEHSDMGKTKIVQITKHSGGGVSHGDKKSAAAEKK